MIKYDCIKKISDKTYIYVDNIIKGIKKQSNDLNKNFKLAYKEVLIELNKKHKFINENSSSFYEDIFNNSEFQSYIINDYKFPSKVVSIILNIKNLDDNKGNKFRVFDEIRTKENLYTLLILCRKYLIFEKDGDSLHFTRNEIYELVEKSKCVKVRTKKKFLNKTLVNALNKINIYLKDTGNKCEICFNLKLIYDTLAKHILDLNYEYSSMEDLKIGKYSFIYNGYYEDILVDNLEDGEFIRKVLDNILELKPILKEDFNIEIDKYISYDKLINNADFSFTDDFKSIADAIDEEINNKEDEDYIIEDVTYYIDKQVSFIRGSNTYYEINLKKAINDNSKGKTVYCGFKIPDNYAIKCFIVVKKIKLLDQFIDIFIIKKYNVAIRPCELKWLIHSIIGSTREIQSTSLFYRNLMGYLMENKCSLCDILTTNDNLYLKFRKVLYSKRSEVNKLFLKAMDRAREIILNDKFESGANILRYITSKLNNAVIKKQIVKTEYNGLFFSRGCYRFDRNPYTFSLINHNVDISDLYKCIPRENYEPDILVNRLKSNMVNEDKLFVNLDEFGPDALEKVSIYNKHIRENYDCKGLIGIVKGTKYAYVLDNLNEINNIIEILKRREHAGIFKNRYKESLNKILPNLKIDSKCKKKVLESSFDTSSITCIVGEAGTGKTELLCNYFTSIFKDNRILYIANTHTCLDNMKQRVKGSGNITNLQSFKTVSSLAKNPYYSAYYDVVIIDECKTISNRNIQEILYKIHTDYLILAGDIGQIDAIDLGNWYEIITKLLDRKNVFKLYNDDNVNYRTSDFKLKTLWKKVRNNESDTFDYLINNGFIENINENIFKPICEEEIVLCLNYGGIYGITSINSYFQNRNKGEKVFNNLDTFKEGDQILFNENANNEKLYGSYIHNNIKGKILKIVDEGEYLSFDIEIEGYIPDISETVISSNEETNSSVVKIRFKKYSSSDDDKNEEEYLCPFTLSYALSIHKAQGLEYDSVKIIITPESEEKIDNKLFYTAITRAKKSLKIYLTKDSQKNIIDKILNSNSKNMDINLLNKINN